MNRSTAWNGSPNHAVSAEASAVSIVDDVRAFANGSGVRDDAYRGLRWG